MGYKILQSMAQLSRELTELISEYKDISFRLISSQLRIAAQENKDKHDIFELKVAPGVWHVQRAPYVYDITFGSFTCIILYRDDVDISRLPLSTEVLKRFSSPPNIGWSSSRYSSLLLCQSNPVFNIDLQGNHNIYNPLSAQDNIIIIPLCRFGSDETEALRSTMNKVEDVVLNEMDQILSDLELSHKYDKDSQKLYGLVMEDLRKILPQRRYEGVTEFDRMSGYILFDRDFMHLDIEAPGKDGYYMATHKEKIPASEFSLIMQRLGKLAYVHGELQQENIDIISENPDYEQIYIDTIYENDRRKGVMV